MKNETNIYDIDGNLIRAAGDNHKFTIEEIEQMVDDLTKKVEENPENNTYKVYLNNVQKWLYNMYNNMSKEELTSRLTILQNSLNEAKKDQNEAEQKQIDEINEAVEKLKQEYKAIDEPKTQEDLLVERESNDTIMDSYTDFEEEHEG